MSNIAKAFANGKAFIPFITCGDPDLETTAAAVRAMAANGADLIELGIPFSDPTAEGPVIQGANIRALKGGVTTDKVFEFVRTLRQDVSIPMVFMTYANVVFSYGAERFISTCAQIGIDGLILPDLPYEEKDEFLPICRRYSVDLISMIAPTSENRIAMIAKEAEGFLYIVSSLGVTGTRSEIKTDLASIVKVVRENTKTPCAIGFGISTPEQAAKMAGISDGAIVGSAIIKLLEQYGKDAPAHIGAYVKRSKKRKEQEPRAKRPRITAKPKTAPSLRLELFFSADGGGRTHTVSLPMDFESTSSAIPTHRHILFLQKNNNYYTGFRGQNQEQNQISCQQELQMAECVGIKRKTTFLPRNIDEKNTGIV